MKPWRSFEQQLDILSKRGMTIDDKDTALKYLRRIGYYRLSGYWYSFRQFKDDQSQQRIDQFVSGTHFKHIVDLYIFDKKLRLMALDALERIEVAVRVDIAYTLGQRSPLAHEQADLLHGNFAKRVLKKGPNAGQTQHQLWLGKHRQLLQRAKREPFIAHHNKYYSGNIPIWVAIETWDFGCMSKLFAGMQHADKTVIAQRYGLTDAIQLEQWLRGLNFIRNVSAHHSRLWNTNILEQAAPVTLDVHWSQLLPYKPFFYFCIMQKMLRTICPQSTWGQRFKELLENFPNVPNGTIQLKDFGLSVDLDSWILWQK